MKQPDASHRSDQGGATILPLRPVKRPGKGPGGTTTSEAKPGLDEAGEIVAQAMSTLLRVQLTERARNTCATNGLASSSELARVIDIFLSIRDLDRRRYCLAVLRGCAMADAEERGRAG